MLINGREEGTDQLSLYPATSPDLETWTFRPAPLLAHDDPALAVKTVYRGSALVMGSQLVIWYSMQYYE